MSEEFVHFVYSVITVSYCTLMIGGFNNWETIDHKINILGDFRSPRLNMRDQKSPKLSLANPQNKTNPNYSTTIMTIS